ncbi:HAAS signaling domain-containing protein [Bacillus sp. AK031]
MKLIEVYIQEVTRRLPEKSRADIALELRSTIEDTLPEDYNEKDVKSVLEKLGNPAALANGYRDQPMHLIGPRYFDVYVSLLKMILPIAAVIAVISMVAEYFIGYSGNEAIMNVVLTIMGKGIWNVIEVGIHVFFWLTLVFAILERMDKEKDQQPLSASLTKWTPDDLKNIPYIPKKKAISKFDVFGSFMWTAIWATLYFYANHLVGVYEGGGEGLQFVIPALNQDILLGYWPIVVAVIALEVGFALYKLIVGQWMKRMAVFNAVFELLSTIVFMVILMNPSLFNQDFLVYMSDLFSTTAKQIETWIISGVIIAFVVSAAINVYEVFRKARV